MRKTTQEIGVYGVVNGLGLSGDPKEKAKLLSRARRAAERGDFGLLLEYLAAYGVGAWVGARLRRAIQNIDNSTEIAYSNLVDRSSRTSPTYFWPSGQDRR